MSSMHNHYVTCDCMSDEHTLRFSFFPDGKDEYPQLYTSVYLNSYESWYRRVWTAVKYVFGHRSKYGDWDCTNIGRDEAIKLRDALDMFIDVTDPAIKDAPNRAKRAIEMIEEKIKKMGEKQSA
jgi:hypothetical protein